MMNKSKIDWCDFSWNPVTGCKHTCEYCYARRIVARFSPDASAVRAAAHYVGIGKNGLYDIAAPWSYDGRTLAYPFGFEPTLHRYRLGEPACKRKPRNIFVGSMTDLFGDWVPDEWIRRVFDACQAAPQHNYLFLTKNPTRYCKIADAGWLPESENFWYGSTITKKGDTYFNGSIQWNTFISVEPLLERLDVGLGSFGGAKWVIVGAETGNRKDKVKPEREWIENIIESAKITQAAVLLKDSEEMREVWGEDIIQEFPTNLQKEGGTDHENDVQG